MRNLLRSTVGKAIVSAALLLATCAYLALATREFLAAHFGAKADLRSLQLAVRLEPRNAQYRYRLGRYFWFVQRSAEAAIAPYQTAIRLNSFEGPAWFDLAAIYQYQGDSTRQEDALQHAVEDDPTTPDVAWEAANLYAVQGETDKALKEFRVVLQYDPYRPPSALAICWHIDPDVDALLQNTIPAQMPIYSIFLQQMISKQETAAAAKVWAAMVQLGEAVKRPLVFAYMNYLFKAREVEQARKVWQQAAPLANLSAYQPKAENLVVNGDFSLDVLNGGFDWFYHQSKDVSLALDPTKFHTGTRSLRMVYDSRGLEDSGIQHLIPVQPNTSYAFSANFRSEDMKGAGGPRFVLQDLYNATVYFSTDPLTDDGFWKNVSGDFTIGSDTRILLLRLQRFPVGLPIAGTVWIDGIKITAKGPGLGEHL